MPTRLHRIAWRFFQPAGEVARAEALVTLLRLRWFLNLRWLFTLAIAATAGVDRLVAAHPFRPRQLYLLIVGLAAANVIWTIVSLLLRRQFADVHARDPQWRSDQADETLERATLFANAQIAVDLLFLTGILRFTGGVENPLAIFYLFHVVISALLLPASNALAQSCWAAALYGTLGYGEWRGFIAPHYPLFSSPLAVSLHTHAAFVAAAVASVTLGVFGALYFTTQITSRLDEHEHELRLANLALARSRDAVRELQERRSRFMRTAAHQLKSPLAGIQTLVNLLRDGVVPPGGEADAHRRIAQRCHDGMAHVGELLSLARVQDADPDRHRIARADVRETLRRLFVRVGPAAEAKGVELTCVAQNPEQLIARIDPRDLSDALGNLLDNAIKYTPAGGSVHATATSDGDVACISIADTGIGIDAASLPHIFEEYRRGESALEAGIPGSGLGLSIVMTVVHQAGGDISVDSRAGAGTTFRVLLPCEERMNRGVGATPCPCVFPFPGRGVRSDT